MTKLIKYEAACRAVAECKAVDEVKAIHNKAEAMRVYARLAEDKTMEVDAVDIGLRAERRLGEMIAAQKAAGGLSRGAAGAGINQHTPEEVRSLRTTAPKLSDAGISKDLSSRAQKLAAVPEAEFEQEMGEWRDRVSAEGARVSTRLQKAGERAIKAKTAAQLEAEQAAEDAHGDFDPIAELESAQAEIADLRAQIKAAEADDQKAETLKWRRLYETAQRAASEKQDAAHRYQTELQRASDRLTRIGKLFGERDPAKIPALVEAFYRRHARAVA